MSPDFVAILIMEIALLLLFLIEIVMGMRRAHRAKKARVSLTVTRGEPSMNMLYVMYGVVTLIYAFAVQVSEAFMGHKVFLLLLNYLILTYTFFFSLWFRNKIFFPLMDRIKNG